MGLIMTAVSALANGSLNEGRDDPEKDRPTVEYATEDVFV
jgi:hypothetical protein